MPLVFPLSGKCCECGKRCGKDEACNEGCACKKDCCKKDCKGTAEQVPTPKTGDSSLGLWLCLAMLALSGAALAAVQGRKRKLLHH